ncbi:MAG: hypothetical protein ABSD88_07045 [Candidatus Korobacteraceae bacterium]|jgi:hypothetical protein
MSKSRFIRGVLIILAFLGVFSGGLLIGQIRGYHRHLENALDALQSARTSIHEARRDMPVPRLQVALEHVEIAIREVRAELHH